MLHKWIAYQMDGLVSMGRILLQYKLPFILENHSFWSYLGSVTPSPIVFIVQRLQHICSWYCSSTPWCHSIFFKAKSHNHTAQNESSIRCPSSWCSIQWRWSSSFTIATLLPTFFECSVKSKAQFQNFWVIYHRQTHWSLGLPIKFAIRITPPSSISCVQT